MAFKLVNPNINFPKLYPRVERVLATATKASHIKVGDHILRKDIDFIPQPGLQEDVCASDCNLIFMCGQATSGKAQPYDAKVLTPKGFVEMGSLKVGDTITGVDGKPQTVLQIFEQGMQDVYGLHFDDGSYTECEKNHLWKVAYRNKNSNNPYGKYRVSTFEELMWRLDNNYAVCVPYCGKMEFEPQELPIKPYTMGAMLGDGHFPKHSNPTLTCYDDEIVEQVRNDGYIVNKIPSHDQFIIKEYGKDKNNGLKLKFKELGLWETKCDTKFIPEIYKTASINDRMELLRGLMDTDGCVDKLGRLYFTTTSKQLANDFQWIIRSLGGRCRITESTPKFKWEGETREGRRAYSLWFSFIGDNEIVNLPRKKKRTTIHKQQRRKAITGYDYVGRKKCRCLLVSNHDHLYITDDFIVTHNTFSMYLKALQGVEKYGFTSRLISVRALDSKKGSAIFRDGVTVCGNFAGCEYSSSEIPTFSWPQWNSNLQLIHSNFNVESPKEWEDFQDYCKKQQSSLIMIDEATEMKHFKMFTYWFMRNRDSSGMTPQMILSFNPLHEHWTTKMLTDGGYLDDDGYYLRDNMIGKVRYFYIKGDNPENIVWGNTRAEVVEACGLKLKPEDAEAGLTVEDYVKSFTVFTGTAAGNRELVNATKGQSVANLHAVGATQRAVVGEAYFGPIDNEELNVTKSMIQNLWKNPYDPKGEMYATMDISSGEKGNDKSPMVIWRGLRIVAIKFFQGEPYEIAPWIQHQLHEYHIDIRNFAYDATGHGFWMKGLTNGIPITSNARVMQEIDEYGNSVQMEQYYNLRSQLLGKMRVMFERGDVSCEVSKTMPISYGKNGEMRNLIDILNDEINVFITTSPPGNTSSKKIYYRNKMEYKKKFHHSPDLMDAITLRAVFELDARERKKPAPRTKWNAYHGLYKQQNRNYMAFSR